VAVATHTKGDSAAGGYLGLGPRPPLQRQQSAPPSYPPFANE
jgi:hypothetical protein